MTAETSKNMGELPAIVRQRMGRVAGLEEHPDPGILTAFVEGSISKIHRPDVLKHLAVCSDCNRLMTFITPELANNKQVLQPAAAPRRWLTWAPLRWAAVSASAAAIVSAVWIGQLNHHQTSNTTTVAQVAPQSATIAAPPSAANATADARRSGDIAKPSSSPQRHDLAKSGSGPTVAPPVVFDPALQAQSRPAVPGEVQGSAGFQTGFVAPPSIDQTYQPETAMPQAPKPVGPAASASTSAGPASPTWSVADGVLKHSTDGGSTWVAVAVPSSATIRVVSATGQHVWVGGDGGSLYHSVDQGRTWTAVVPAADGHVLSANIIRMAFMNPMHGWVVDADGGYWATRDGGVTWTFQLAQR